MRKLLSVILTQYVPNVSSPQISSIMKAKRNKLMKMVHAEQNYGHKIAKQNGSFTKQLQQHQSVFHLLSEYVKVKVKYQLMLKTKSK